MNIMLIGIDGKVIGNVSMEDAKRRAKEGGQDLIVVNPKSNIYRIADKGRLKFEQRQKEKQVRAQQRAQKIKEIRFTPQIEKHDLDTKVNHIKEFLQKGHKTKLTMTFKSRQLAFKELGLEKMKSVVAQIVAEGIGVAEGQPKLEGRDLIVFISPK